jgi:hypothetical protein
MSQLATLCLLLSSAFVPGPVNARPAPQSSAAAPTIDLTKLSFNEQMRRAPARHEPEVSAMVMSALRRYADGSVRPTAFDAAIDKAMKKVRNGRTIAKRVVGRIDALPQPARARAFSTRSTSTAVTRGGFAAAAAKSGLGYAGVGVTSPTILPDENVAVPSSYQLSLRGIGADRIDDADGADEVVAMTTVIQPAGSGWITTTVGAPATGAVSNLVVGDVEAVDRTILEGKPQVALVASVVFEADDDDAERRAEYLAMVALAGGLAEQLIAPNDFLHSPLVDYAFALDYTVGLLALSDPARWPAGALQKTMLGLGADIDLHSLYSTPPTMAGAVPWKLAHVHDTSAGKYTLYYDVPAPALARPNIRVKIVGAKSFDPEVGGDDLRVEVEIGDASVAKNLGKNKNTHTLGWAVQRKVLGGQDVALKVRLLERDDGPSSAITFSESGISGCGEPQFAPCPEIQSALDVDAAAGAGELNLVLHLATGKITGDATGDLGETLSGTGATGKRGKLDLIVTVD